MSETSNRADAMRPHGDKACYNLSRFARSAKLDRYRGILKAGAAASALLVNSTPLFAQGIVPNPAIVANPLTGMALQGYDIVSYFIEGRAIAGKSAHQSSYAGVGWQFQSPANRAVFEAGPARFMPAYGGHDATALAEGVLREGDPRQFLRIRDKLYFFRTPEARERFAAHPELNALATREWPRLKRDFGL